MIGTIIGAIFFAVIIIACCASADAPSNGGTAKTRPASPRKTPYRQSYSYCECPSCGAPGYDGYCEECGYPDINQGWIGENY